MHPAARLNLIDRKILYCESLVARNKQVIDSLLEVVADLESEIELLRQEKESISLVKWSIYKNANYLLQR